MTGGYSRHSADTSQSDRHKGMVIGDMGMLFTYLVGCVGLIIKPGPDLLCTVATALSHGRVRAICLMGGLVLGCWTWVVLLALGVSAFLQAHPIAMLCIRYGGMAYIGYLAFGCLVEARNGFRAPSGFSLSSPHERGIRLVGRGILMSMSNPLTIMFFLAFLPHFTSQDSGLSPSVQILMLGTLFCAIVPILYLPIICAADALKTMIESKPRFSPSIKLASGCLLAAVVVLLAVG